MTRRRPATLLSLFVASALFPAACAVAPPAGKPPFSQQRPLNALMEAAAYPNSDTVTVLVTMQELLATHRAWDGYRYFGRLAEEQPTRRPLFRSLQGVMQARVAQDVPLEADRLGERRDRQAG